MLRLLAEVLIGTTMEKLLPDVGSKKKHVKFHTRGKVDQLHSHTDKLRNCVV